MASIRVDITNATRKDLQELLALAYRLGDHRLVRRVTAVLSLAQSKDVYLTMELVSAARSSVYVWLCLVLTQGVDSLKLRKSPGRPPRLTKPQKQQLVQQWIEREFGVLYNRYYVCELLHNLGFSYQKAAFVADHLNPDARQQWLEETWPEILRTARAKDAWILFGDEVSFAQWGSLSYTWARKGQQPVVKTSGKRKGFKVLGVIEFFSGRFFSQTLTNRFNSASYQTFLSYVLAQTDRPVILIQDGARYHTSRSMRDFFAAHEDRLIVYQLPSYSPDYNPIEFLWKQAKQRATHNQYFQQFDKLMASVDEALAYFARQAVLIKNLMGGYLQSLELVTAVPVV